MSDTKCDHCGGTGRVLYLRGLQTVNEPFVVEMNQEQS